MLRNLFTKGPEDRGITPIIAIALLALLAIGAVVLFSGPLNGIVSGVEEPPSAQVEVEPLSDTEVQLTVMSADNADELYVTGDGDSVSLSASVGSTAEVTGLTSDNAKVNVVAHVDPDQNRTVRSYTMGG